jgi:hypothetical protein
MEQEWNKSGSGYKNNNIKFAKIRRKKFLVYNKSQLKVIVMALKQLGILLLVIASSKCYLTVSYVCTFDALFFIYTFYFFFVLRRVKRKKTETVSPAIYFASCLAAPCCLHNQHAIRLITLPCMLKVKWGKKLFFFHSFYY